MAIPLGRRLEAMCPGRVVVAGDARYDTIRQLFNGVHDRRPAYICLPRTNAEIAAVVRVANDAGMPLTVRGGGHNVAGSGSCDGGLLLDLRLMRDVRVDPDRRLARVAGGATWTDVDLATTGYGLATTGGTVGSTGVAGLTLGGGLGYLSRRFGLTCDTVESYQLVTAAGEVLHVDAETEPELSQLLRGAGHNLGVVQEFTFRLGEVPQVHGGRFTYAIRHAATVISAFTELMADAPPELTCLLLLEPWGRPATPVVVANVCYTGTDPAVVARVERLLSCAPLLDHDFVPRSYLSMQASQGEPDFGLRHYWTTCSTTGLPAALADELVDQYLRGGYRDGIEDIIIVTPLGGAVATAPQPSAISFRSAAYAVLAMAIWRDRGHDEEQIAWAKGVTEVARPWSIEVDGYVNYASEPAARSTAAAPLVPAGLLTRLPDLRRRVDPDGIFGGTAAEFAPVAV